MIARIVSSGLALLLFCTVAQAADPKILLQQLADYPHAIEVDSSIASVVDHEVGLGTIKKVRGVWQFKDSERLSGELSRHTFQIVDGFSSSEVMDELQTELAGEEGSELLFACDGRACGKGVQWANRIFRQRVLYGREDLQRYSVYRINGDATEYRFLIYAAARTADRQYLHVELLTTHLQQ